MAATAQAMSLPRSTFAKLSPHEFLLANLQPSDQTSASQRTNGRQPSQPRNPSINTGSLTHAHGSAVVRVGDTTVICGVRGEILPVAQIPQYRPQPLEVARSAEQRRRELRDYDLLVPNIELATGCAPQFLPGVPPTPLAQTLSTRVYSLLHSTELLDAEELRIWYRKPTGDASDGEDVEMGGGDAEEGGSELELKAYWTLYIDLLFISFDGNPFDAAWAATLAALKDTKLPKAYWDADREMILCSRGERTSLSMRGLPIACTASVVLEREHGEGGKHYILVDPDRLEEGLCDETVTIVVDCTSAQTRIRSTSKSGGRVVGLNLLKQLVGVAEARWQEFNKLIG